MLTSAPSDQLVEMARHDIQRVRLAAAPLADQCVEFGGIEEGRENGHDAIMAMGHQQCGAVTRPDLDLAHGIDDVAHERFLDDAAGGKLLIVPGADRGAICRILTWEKRRRRWCHTAGVRPPDIVLAGRWGTTLLKGDWQRLNDRSLGH